MPQYSFTPIAHNSFELGTQLQLLYFRHFTPDDTVPVHELCSHQDHAELIFILQGKGSCTIAGNKHSFQAGDLIAIDAGALHEIFHIYSDDINAVLIGINHLHLQHLKANHLLKEKQSPVIAAGDKQQFFNQAFNLIESLSHFADSEDSTKVCSHIAQGIIVLLEKLAASGNNKQHDFDYNLGVQAKEFIDEHFQENIRLTDIANALHVNPYYLSHIFKKIMNYTPIQYLIHRRIGEAQNMLISTDMTITDIAISCGYNNSNYFQVVFKQLVGMTPGKYRKSWR